MRRIEGNIVQKLFGKEKKMKDFWKKRHKWIIPVGVTALVAIVWWILYLNGFRFNHNSELSITWEQSAVIADWIGAIATIVGVIVSGIAIFYAIRVPKEIADRQDRIALFEKRYDCYWAVEEVLQFARVIKDSNDASNIEEAITFVMHLQNQKCEDLECEVLPYFWNLERIVSAIDCLFPNCKSKKLQDALGNIESLVLYVFGRVDEDAPLNSTDLENKNMFVKLCQEFEQECLPIMKNELNLKVI